ncbi:putative quinol monooxygenase [Salegentibacter sediminis]|uniref:putative quinol monooxygenase n=1 Tax=Salegentibacter sediminis TaxID=1930251 RepID=UPI0009C16743|nr:putative quinol monooxygenase [Salegentibacter sediminis]
MKIKKAGMKLPKVVLILFLAIFCISSYGQEKNEDQDVEVDEMIIRMAKIKVYANHRDEYIAILNEEAEASIKLEPGVICIYPMYQKENPTEIRLLEIYANKKAYQSHLETPHFKSYKEKTRSMIDTLELIDMEALDKEAMPLIFSKIKE